jgi:hypothetical protein
MDNQYLKEQNKGGCLWLIVLLIIIYLSCSLFSWDFKISEWNWFSKIIGIIGLLIEGFIIFDLVQINTHHGRGNIRTDLTEDEIRKQFSLAFDDAVQNSNAKYDGSLNDDAYIEETINKLYYTLLNERETVNIYHICENEGLDYHALLYAERCNALKKYLKLDD